MKHHNVSGVLSILALFFFVSVAHSTTFDFNTDNQGWRRVGLYDCGSLDPIPGYFSDDPAPWSDVPGSGAIYLGSGGFTMPASPSGSTYLHWDLNSPDLSGNVQWQGITSFTYDVTGEYMWSSATIYIQAVLHVKKSDGTESYFSDFQFHEIPLESAGAWDSHTLDVTNLGLPAGATILGVNLRIFFEASSGHDGFIFVDNVTPAGASIVTTLSSGVPVVGLSGGQGSEAFYKIRVPSGASKLEIKISGGTGDCDLYVKKGAKPTQTNYDYRPYLSSNNETVTVNNPSAGWWYIMLRGYRSYSGVTLVAEHRVDELPECIPGEDRYEPCWTTGGRPGYRYCRCMNDGTWSKGPCRSGEIP